LKGDDLLTKNHSCILVLTVLLVAIVSSVNQVQGVEAVSPTVYIRADGRVDPPESNVTNVGNVTYTVTEDIVTTYNAIIVERDNIILDGTGHTLQTGGSTGIELRNRNNVTVRNFRITGCYHGIFMDSTTWITIDNNTITSSHNALANGYGAGPKNFTLTNNNATGNTNGLCPNSVYDGVISGNIIQQCGYGLILHGGENVTVKDNLITGCTWGIWPLGTDCFNISIFNNTISNNYCGVNKSGGTSMTLKIYRNYFVNNTIHAIAEIAGTNCSWDDGYPSGGNYWSGYVSPDLFNGPYQNVTGGDGIGDNPFIINYPNNNKDRYPFMFVSICNVSQTPPKGNVTYSDAVSVNATVTHLNPMEQVILNCTYTNTSVTWTESINMTNVEDDIWNGIIPTSPLGTNVTYMIIAQDNSGNSMNSAGQGYTFEYPVVVPEFSTMLILPIFMIVILITIIPFKRKCTTSHPQFSRF
jgi:parallel beta-helix repeat protein